MYLIYGERCTGVCDLGAFASEGTKVEDEGETSGVVCSRHGLIASPADVAKEAPA